MPGDGCDLASTPRGANLAWLFAAQNTMADFQLRPFRRQFVLGPQPWRFNEHAGARQVAPDVWLSYDEALPVTEVTGRDGLPRFLLGHAANGSTGQPVSAGELADVTVANYTTETASWGGRWLFLIGGRALTDVGGLLGLFYSSAAPGSVWASSSGVLLCRRLGRPEMRKPLAIAPTGSYGNFSLLLPGETLDLRGARVELVHTRPFWRVQGSEQDLVGRAVTLLDGLLRGYHAFAGPGGLLIGLSGGADGRRNAAIAARAGLNPGLYTFRKSWFVSTSADRDLPREVARALGLACREVSGAQWEATRHALWVEHTGDAAADARPGSNYFYFVRGFWEQLGYGRTTVEGLCYELGANYYYGGHWGIPADFSHLQAAGRGAACTAEELALTDRFWSQLIFDVEIDRRDLLFWTYTMGTAYSRVYYESDVWTDALCPANCRLLYSIMMSLPPARREGKGFQNQITVRAMPALAALPINPPDHFWRHQYTRWCNLRRLAATGGPRAVARKFYRM